MTEKTHVTTSIRIQKDTQKTARILATTYDMLIGAFYDKAIKHINSLPKAELDKILK